MELIPIESEEQEDRLKNFSDHSSAIFHLVK